MSPIGSYAPTCTNIIQAPNHQICVAPTYIVIIQWAHEMVASLWDDELSIRASIVTFTPRISFILGICTTDSHHDYSAIIIGLTSVWKTHSRCEHWGSYRGSYLSNNWTLSSQKAWHNDTKASSTTYWTLGGHELTWESSTNKGWLHNVCSWAHQKRCQ